MNDVIRILLQYFPGSFGRRSYGMYTGFEVYEKDEDLFVDHVTRAEDEDGWGIREREKWLPKYEEVLKIHYTVERVGWGTKNARLKITSRPACS